MTNTDTPPSRTAAATAAAARRAQERRADYLRERGWTCIPPGGLLVAVVRPDGERGWSRVEIRQQPGDLIAVTFRVLATVPDNVQRVGQLVDLGDCLQTQGYRLMGAWRVGADAGGRYASVWVERARP